MDTNSQENFDFMTSNGSFHPNYIDDVDLVRPMSKPERKYINGNNIVSNYQNRDPGMITDLGQCVSKDIGNPSSMFYQPQETNLEKLFSHATEVKGDLESVINTLVEIIGNGENQPTNEQNRQEVLRNHSVDLGNVAYSKPRNFANIYGIQSNINAVNKESFSVNVENVLKKVRANKRNNVRYKMAYDSSQSSESSREKITEKREQITKNCVYNTRSLLSDPGHIEGRTQYVDNTTNRRKHKVKNYSINNSVTGWIPTDLCIKRSKSIKAEANMSNEFVPMQIPNTMLENMNESSKNCHHWVSSDKFSVNSNHCDSRELYNLHKPEMQICGPEKPDALYYKQQPNYGWNVEKEASNIHDESSCSSWSVVSHNQSNLKHGQNVGKSRYQYGMEKETPSISVSDSEGSTEPPRLTPVKRIPRLPSLGTQLKSKEGQYELMLINEPEQHHRARYMTEGSRGAVKDRTGNGFPTIQLLGWKRPATLQIFVGTEDGRVKPHNFYQACKVSGKQILLCKERIFDGTGLIEIQIEAKESQMIILDCIGILKLRNVDVERRGGVQRVKLKSTMARLVFRVNLPHGDGFFTCLQVASDPILCTQPVGSPEICKMSLYEGSCKGNMELFIIGKNIVKCCQVLFQDYSEYKGVIWQAEARLDVEYLHQSHLVCTVPPYCNENLKTPVTVQVVINCSGRLSEPRYFTYLSDNSPKSFNLMDSYEMEEWKMLKTDFTNMPPFPMEGHLLTGDQSRGGECGLKSSNEVMFDQEYDKLDDQSFPHQKFCPSTNQQIYNSLDNLPMRNVMEWMPCTSISDLSISTMNMPSSFDTISNSLESNIQNDSILHFSPYDSSTVLHSESLNTLTESTDILTNL